MDLLFVYYDFFNVILIVFSVVLLLLLLLLLFFIAVIPKYKTRYDYSLGLKYFLPKDFDDISYKEIKFNSSGVEIIGGIYSLDSKKDRLNKIIIFAPGDSPGQFAYTTLIRKFVLMGYDVLSYDNYGTGYSGGINRKSLYQSTFDLVEAIKYIKESELYSTYPISLIGHSHGGYCVGTVLSFFPDLIESVVCISGLFDFSSAIADRISFFKPFKFLINLGLKILYGGKSSLTIWRGLEDSPKTKFLYLVGEKENMICKSFLNSSIYKKIKDKKNITTKIVKDKYHNPYLTIGAEEYLRGNAKYIFGSENVPEGFYFDLEKSTEIDDSVISTIKEFLD
ncbi:MAG: alpha/beta hydrolase [Acholeplasmatales bacterium]|jgi:pimeloyl-ACP methyl ester carboxylesterase|nr:alpha/beta hydrolase [Acholeplasmatales bacterium]